MKSTGLAVGILLFQYLVIAPSSGAEIQFKNFSFAAPDSELLTTQVLNDRQAVFSFAKDGAFFQLTFQENFTTDESMKNLPAHEFADKFREQEKQIMMEEGVKKGAYQLQNLEIGEELLGGKLYYTMTYTAKLGSAVQLAQLYLYFPDENEVDHFLWAHYSEAVPSQEILSKSLKNVFLNMLETVSFSSHDDQTIGSVTVLEVKNDSVTAWGREPINAAVFRSELAETMRISGLFTNVMVDPGGDFQLQAEILHQKPADAWAKKVPLLIRYTLVETTTSAVKLDSTIFSNPYLPFKKSFKDPSGKKRHKKVLQASIQDNFKRLVGALEGLPH